MKKSTRNGKRTILLILHMPPPVHGAAMVGKYIHDSKLINSEFDCSYINLAMASELEDIGKMEAKKIWRFLVLLLKIWKEVKLCRPDLVYITPNAKGGAFFKEYIIVQMLKALRCKVVAHYHNKGVSTKQDQWLYNLLYKRFFKGLKVILLGKSLYQDVEKYVKREDVYILPNGIPVEVRGKNIEVRGEDLVPRLLFISNLIESKGVIILLDGLKILQDKGYSFVCDFVGGETSEIDAKRFEDEVERRELTDVAVYKGKKYGEEKASTYANADVLVFPTYSDCFPLVLIEAMSQGLPCITTNEGAISDIVEDGVNGLIAERNDAQSLAEKTELMLRNSEMRRKMGQAGFEKFQREFTLEIFENRMCEILNQCSNAEAK